VHVQVYTSSQYPSVFVVFPICTLDHQINKKKTFTEGFSLFIDFGCKSVTWEKYTVKEVIRPPLAHPIDIDVFYLFLQKRKITSTTWCLRLKSYHHHVRHTTFETTTISQLLRIKPYHHHMRHTSHLATIISPSYAPHNHTTIIQAYSLGFRA
jgi:hypothetical protein